jgi:uncharacterized membrane protein YczE
MPTRLRTVAKAIANFLVIGEGLGATLSLFPNPDALVPKDFFPTASFWRF